MKRLAEFLKSVTPQDRAQLLFLAGTVCLVIAPRLSWWPAGLEITREHRDDWLYQQIGAFRGVLSLPITFAALAAYFIAFWPGPQPVRRILSCIYLPTVPILALLCLRFAVLANPHRSVLETVGAQSRSWSAFPLWKLPGLQFCFVGLLLIGIFTQRLIVGRSSLPLTLPTASLKRHDHPHVWRRTQILIWVLIGPLFLISALTIIPLLAYPHFVQFVRSSSFSSLAAIAQMLLALSAGTYIIGRSAVPLLRRALRLPSEKGVLLAAAFSIGIPVLISAGEYLFDRAGLLPHHDGTVIWAPGTYFHAPHAMLLLLFFPALLEEIVFRGFLQPRLTQRYGIFRGIFLVGIVWSAFHFPSDFAFSHFGTLDAIHQLVFRLCVCLPLSFVLGWLTLETGSVLSAALAHTSYNVLLFTELGPPFPGKGWLTVMVWASLGWLLFHYWPGKRDWRLPEPSQVLANIAPGSSASVHRSSGSH